MTDEKGPSQASRLVALAEESYRLVQGMDGRAYAVDRRGPAVALPLRGRDGLRQRLARTYYTETNSAASSSALSDAMTVIEGMAAESPAETVGLRVAAHPGGMILDLGDATGRVVRIEPGRWWIEAHSPVLFRRTALTQPLPVPQRPGSLDGFRQLLNVDDDGFALIVAWLLAALIPNIPHPILALLGEQGTAKSTAAAFCVGLIDPSPAPLRSAPKDVKAWAVTATASWTVALDNVSTIAPWFSDTLCKAVTGDGIVDRALFTDDDVTVLAFRRVIALTSIDAGSLAGDLAERMVPVELQRITPDRRRPDADVAADYRQAQPATLAALLDLLAGVLAALPTVELAELPRMADFARMLAALDTVTGWNSLAAYQQRTNESNHAVVESDPFATAITAMVKGTVAGWAGTIAELLATITPEHPPRGWPRTNRAAGGHLRRISPALRACGINVEATKSNGERIFRLTPDQEAPPVQGAWIEQPLQTLPGP
ncbi:hypothetical protein LWF15_09540 [Kineosporia rhizophila]|uniref:hypothetical protein n=1 Tax=Kineosporia rhizophila TaxID=84633 RepID=UPI001E28D57C|nr:hypothetical protein [Kineosporia rhizophila]MCE0535756.1 hypothetical protein [Kineosporia rhizophila]